MELNAAASYGIPTIERSVLLGYVSRLYKQSICVSGTHGKTTTTSMITTALELAGRHREMGAMMRMVSTGRRMNLTTEGTTLLTNRSTYGSTSVIRKMGMTEEE